MAAAIVIASALLFGCGKNENKTDKETTSGSEVEQEKKSDTGEEATPTTEKPSVTAITPVFAFLGGYTSCPKNVDGDDDPLGMDLIDMFESAKGAVAAIEGLNDPAFLLSCYSFDPESISYVVSTNPEKIRFSKVSNMESDFAKLLSSTPNPIVFLVGHSYGAYTALKMISNSAEGTKISGLVTLDAISKLGCTPANALPAVLETGPAPQACLEAPADIESAEQKAILAKAPTWLNFYQTDSTILHSSEFSSAKNFKMHYEGTKIKPHMDVLFDPDIEESILDLIKTNIKAAQVPG
jgi:hypothetical protein